MSLALPYELLPFRFARIPALEKILITSEAGEYAFLSTSEFQQLLDGTLSSEQTTRNLEAKQFIYRGDPSVAIRLAGAKLGTRKSFLRGGPSLHIFVVSLRCDHSCHYCKSRGRMFNPANLT